MQKMFKKVLVALICVLMLFGFTACADIETAIQLVLEIEDADETETDTSDRTYARAGGEDIILPEDFVYPELANRISGMILPDTDTYVANINLSQYRSDSYLFINGSSLTVDANFYLTDANGEPADINEDWRNVKIALWEKGQNQAVYLETVYFIADSNNQTYTFTGLNTGGEYRIAITYSDHGGYYVNGNFRLSSISGEGSQEETLAQE